MSGGVSEERMLRDVWLAAAAELEQAEIEDARFEAEVLLRHAVGLSRAQFYAALTDPIAAEALTAFRGAVSERTTRKPLAYITGTREFYRLEFQVTPDVLIPRPESELLVDTALDHLRKSRVRSALVADVGAGSGAIGIAIAKHRRGVEVVCSDVSREALRVARNNAERLLRRPKLSFVQADLLTALQGPFHCVVANLPYIPEDRLPQLEPEVGEHEPRLALTPGTSGSALILRLLTQLQSRWRRTGWRCWKSIRVRRRRSRRRRDRCCRMRKWTCWRISRSARGRFGS